MSFEAMKWARDIKCGSPSRKAVLLLLANCADPDGVCWPSVRYISESIEIGKSTVHRALEDLRQMGLLEVEARTHQSGASRSNLFRLRLDLDGPQKQAGSTPKNQGGEGVTVEPPGVSPWEGGGSTAGLLEVKEEQPRKTVSTRVTKAVVTEEDRVTASWMADRVQALFPSAKRPSIEAWANEVRLLRTQDRHELSEICRVFDWANRDTRFWQRVILSPRNLRKHYTRLFLEANVFQKPEHERPRCLHCPGVATLTAGSRAFCDEHAHLAKEQ